MFFVGAIELIGRQILSKHLSVDVGCLVWMAQLILTVPVEAR
jgi:hypothetical protein